MLEPSYNLLFGKLALKCLFEDYFEEARQFSAKFLLKPMDDPHVDLVASVSILTTSFPFFLFLYLYHDMQYWGMGLVQVIICFLK